MICSMAREFAKQEDMHVYSHAHISIIHKSQMVEATQVLIYG